MQTSQGDMCFLLMFCHPKNCINLLNTVVSSLPAGLKLNQMVDARIT
jgi:hypothetical protein